MHLSRYPLYAELNGGRYRLERMVPHAIREGLEIVECRDEAGNVFYASKDEWIEGARRFGSAIKEEGAVTSDSPSDQKVALLRRLFGGRQDVYAHGYRRKDGGIGYAPACANEWRRGKCPKCFNPKSRCTECGARQLRLLDDRAIVAHIAGADDAFRDVVALYPIDAHGNTSVLVADFDKDGWEDGISAFRCAAASLGVDVAIERSRSGNGGHAWIFFEPAVSAKLARELGSVFITEAMKRTKNLNFSAYDRLIPAQDTIPKGGFGNAIALPFQGIARREGNSVFVDDSFVPYDDQWLFLSRTKKTTEGQARAIIEAYRRDSAEKPKEVDHVGERGGREKARSKAPWNAREVRRLTCADFPQSLEIVKADMLYVPEEGLSPAAADAIQRVAAFGNPEFYRAQNMHQSVYGKPRFVVLGETRGGFIALPRGCESELIAVLKQAGVRFAFEDRRYSGKAIDVSFVGELRGDQLEAAEKLLEYDDGILSAPTGFGKTVIGAYLLSRIKLPTLIIVPKTALISQWIDKMAKFLLVEEDPRPLLTPSGKPSKRKLPKIGQIGGGKSKAGGIVDIATFQSLVEKTPNGVERAKGFVRDYGLVICDECHHAAAPQLERVLKSAFARKVYGLSATPRRADGLDKALFMLCGPIRCEIDPKTQAQQQGFERVLIPKYVRFRFPDLESGASFNQVLDAICTNEARNRLISNDVMCALDQGRMPLAISKRKEHARLLAAMIEEAGKPVRLLVGEGTPRQRKEMIAKTVADSERQSFAVVATESYLGEGFDMPRLDALFLATPISWDGNVAQQSGRLHRDIEGKAAVFVHDYVDVSIPMLERMHKRRLKSYASLGYRVVPDVETGEGAEATFVDCGHFRSVFERDVSDSKKVIEIFAPYVSESFVSIVASGFARAISRGVSVNCVICKVNPLLGDKIGKVQGDPLTDGSAKLSEAVKQLERCGCNVVFNEAAPSGLAVFDEKIVWYGNLPLLAFPKSPDCSLRFESAEVAHDVRGCVLGSEAEQFA